VNTYVYKKHDRKKTKRIIRFTGLLLLIAGIVLGMYTLLPLVSWELYLKPAFASNTFASPIPQTTIMTKDTIKSLLSATAHSLEGSDWLPAVYNTSQVKENLSAYSLSLPRLHIQNATVSTVDTDLNHHLVNFPGTALPPNKGNAVIFGHSTLPQLYDPQNYKTIFANILNVRVGDDLQVTVHNTLYTYKIFSIIIVDAEDMSYLTQDQDDSYISIVTCTPPGTTWKRLIIKARIEKI